MPRANALRIGKSRRMDTANLAMPQWWDPRGADTKMTFGATPAQGQRTGFDQPPTFWYLL